MDVPYGGTLHLHDAALRRVTRDRQIYDSYYSYEHDDFYLESGVDIAREGDVVLKLVGN